MSEHTLFELIRVCLAVSVVVFTVSVIVLIVALTAAILIPGIEGLRAKR